MKGKFKFLGKLPPHLLKELVLKRVGKLDPRVLVGPNIGEDAAIIDLGEKVLVVHSDPITGTSENIGWLSLCVSTNDVATRGAKPLWVSVVILLPENSDMDLIDKITSQLDEAAKKLDLMIVCGHTEISPGLDRPILVTTALGEASKSNYVTSSGCKVGDAILLTKGAAIEGTLIFAAEFEDYLKNKVPVEIIQRAKSFLEKLSVLKEAMLAVDVGGISAMHDPTEGGVIGGLQELCWASGVGFKLYEEKVIINEETRIICEAIGADPLKTISSGSLLIVINRNYADKLVERLRAENIPASVIGEIINVEEGFKLVRKNGEEIRVNEPVEDELWRILRELKQF